MSQCPPGIPVTNDPQIIRLSQDILNLWNQVNNPGRLAATLVRPVAKGGTSTAQKAVSGDQKWIEVKITKAGFVIDHIGPDDSYGDDVNTIVGFSYDSIGHDLVAVGFVEGFDAKGHYKIGTGRNTVFRIPLKKMTVVTGASLVTGSSPGIQINTTDVWVLATENDTNYLLSGTNCP